MAREDGYLSGKESRRISKENRKITAALEKKRKRKNVPESEYLTEMKNPENTVEFENLRTYFYTDAGTVKSVDSVSFSVPMGKTVGVVGESGCGKSVTSLSLMQLLQRPQGQIVDGAIRLNTGDKVYDITKTPETVMQHLRGNFMSMIFQEPMTSLNPVFKIGDQVDEVLLFHKSGYETKEAAKKRTIELLEMVGIANSEGVYNMYPHELSGGMRQRIVIAMALACSPKLIIADEPTTALDVTIQAQILDLLRGLKDKINSSIMLITHDLGVIAEMADYVVVMYSGRVVEAGTAKEIFSNPSHPYTIGLMASKPVVGKHVDKLYSIPGKVPNPINMPNYCYFRDRCDKRKGCCDGAYPGEISLSETHRVSCYLYDEEARK
ncbi:peptide/nickel transport system ATP-binding protein [Oribacterium sinus]|jgi:oligopeptide/dipeptide ABC transporter, ATP-binding protein, C-terminal domain|uniref:ABC transporter, ATP-binding protein n=2 Tax=Oribacterium sinus TaxID=237576 RepID=C2KUE3_9FIRM|nr:ABC transporter ATP-binding protein [Oribacterium sinus]EEJ52594.1 ABC transporter, ATP-binding protein [Oribacterium sinus F0268]MBB6041230.1 peptide/nickel transport system ATP-binding protein [Oribacterium sinus]